MRLFRTLWSEIGAWVLLIVRFWPESPVGNILRRFYWSRRMSLGRDATIHRGAICYVGAPVVVGDRFALGEDSILDPNDSLGIYIGSDVSIARDTFVRSANHRFDDLNVPIMEQGHKCARIRFGNADYSIVIEDGVLISRGVTILSGAHIGRGSVLGAGVVLSKPVPPYSVVKGPSAQVVRSREDPRPATGSS